MSAKNNNLVELLEKIFVMIDEKANNLNLAFGSYGLLIIGVWGSGEILETLFKIGSLLWVIKY